MLGKESLLSFLRQQIISLTFLLRVKLAIDTNQNKQVAIKVLRVMPGGSRRKALECLNREIKILAECDHPNIAKIIEASFNGIITKEQSAKESSP